MRRDIPHPVHKRVCNSLSESLTGDSLVILALEAFDALVGVISVEHLKGAGKLNQHRKARTGTSIEDIVDILAEARHIDAGKIVFIRKQGCSVIEITL